MAKKLKDDNINLTLSVGTDKSQENIRKLNDATAKLNATNDKLLEKMAKLSAQGRENTEAYAKLSDQLEKNEEKIAANGKKVQELTSNLTLNTKSMKQLRKDARDLQKLMDDLDPNSEEWKKYNAELQAVSKRMREVKAATYDTRGFISKTADTVNRYWSVMAAGAAAVIGVFQKVTSVVRDAFRSTQQSSDKLNETIRGIDYSYQELMRTFATGDWSNFIDRLKEAYELGVEVEKILDELYERNNSFRLTDVKVQAEIEKQFEAMQNVNLSNEERLKAGERIQELTKRQAEAKKDIYKQELEAADKTLTFVTRLTDAEKKYFIEDYNQNRQKIQQAQEILDLREKSQELQLKETMISGRFEQELKEVNEQLKQTESSYIRMRMQALRAGDSTIDALSVLEKYNRSNDDVVTPYVNALEAVYTIDVETDRSLRRINNQVNSLIKSISDTKEKQQDDSSKAAKEREAQSLKDLESLLDAAHQERLIKLKQTRKDEAQTEAQYQAQVAQEEVDAYGIRLSELSKFLNLIKDSKLRDEVEKKLTADRSRMLDSERGYDQARLNLMQEAKDKELKAVQDTYGEQKALLDKDLAQKRITQEQYNLKLVTLDGITATQRLQVLKKFQGEALSIELQSGDLKAKAVEEANDLVLEAEVKAAQDRAAMLRTLAEAVPDFRKQLSLLSPEEETQGQLDALEKLYHARFELLMANEEDTTALTLAYEQARSNILLKSDQDRYNQRKQLGLTNWEEDFKAEQALLKTQLDAEIITREDYEKALLKLRISYLDKYVDRYAQVFSGTITALQDAEIANTEAKYDAEIAAAGSNAQEVERLEKEKAQKTLDIQKKYADVNFAIKASQIIADTAVGIMSAFQLGPIAGAIAAALIGITGVAQLASANAERKKVKAMTLSGGSSASGGQRVVTGGFAEGGYTGDGDRYEVAGAVHRGEYVVAVPEMRQPTVMGHVKAIERIRRKRTTRNSLNGFAEGGYTGDTGSASAEPYRSDDELKELVSKNIELLQHLADYGVTAFVSLSQLEQQQALAAQSRQMGTRPS